MKLLVVLSSLLITSHGASTNHLCEEDNINGVYYDSFLLKTGLDRPFLLDVDHETNTLYFNYNVGEDEFKSARLNLKTKEFKNIEGIPNGFSHAVDSKNHVLYIGTENGIYVYDLKTDQSKFLGAKGHFIWTLFLKDDVLYFSEHSSQRLYTYSQGVVEKLKDLEHTKVHYFVMDGDNDMFFTNDTGLYKHVKGSTDAVKYKTFEDNWEIRALVVDLSGNVYAGFMDGVYAVEKDEANIEKVLHIYDLFGFTFDGDDKIIYADYGNIFHIKPSKDKNC